MSFKIEVIADGSGKWCGNALRFATEEEAQRSAESLQDRWMLVREIRVVESDDTPNYEFPADADRETAIPKGTA
jgi:hypothetical protein